MITRRLSLKRKRDLCGDDEEQEVSTKVARKKERSKNICSADGCTNYSKIAGLCIRHGAEIKLCSSEGCTNVVVRGGVCRRHGAKVKRCVSEGCTSIAVKGGVCVKHGAEVKGITMQQ